MQTAALHLLRIICHCGCAAGVQECETPTHPRTHPPSHPPTHSALLGYSLHGVWLKSIHHTTFRAHRHEWLVGYLPPVCNMCSAGMAMHGLVRLLGTVVGLAGSARHTALTAERPHRRRVHITKEALSPEKPHYQSGPITREAPSPEAREALSPERTYH